MVAPDWSAVTMDEHHQLVKALGQPLCTPNNPTCFVCTLLEQCPTGRTRIHHTAVLQSNY